MDTIQIILMLDPYRILNQPENLISLIKLISKQYVQLKILLLGSMQIGIYRLVNNYSFVNLIIYITYIHDKERIDQQLCQI